MGNVLRRAEQRVRLCQLRDHSGAANRGEPADGNHQPVLDRVGTHPGAEGEDHPHLEDEIKQRTALKGDTTLTGQKKIEKLRQIGVSIDEKIQPLLNAEQQPKFQEMRAALRRRILVKMAGEVGAKLEDTAELKVEKLKQDLETLKEKVQGVWIGR